MSRITALILGMKAKVMIKATANRPTDLDATPVIFKTAMFSL